MVVTNLYAALGDEMDEDAERSESVVAVVAEKDTAGAGRSRADVGGKGTAAGGLAERRGNAAGLLEGETEKERRPAKHSDRRDHPRGRYTSGPNSTGGSGSGGGSGNSRASGAPTGSSSGGGSGVGGRYGKREFDRHSGTGRGREVAKGGAGGKFTVGNPSDDARQATSAANHALHRGGNVDRAVHAAYNATMGGPPDVSMDSEEFDTNADGTAAANGEAAPGDNPADVDGDAKATANPVPIPEVPQMTLKEWRESKQHEDEKLNLDTLLGNVKPSPRGNGTEQDFKNMVALKKNVDTEIFPFVSDGTKTSKAGKARSSQRDSVAHKGMNIQEFFRDSPSSFRPHNTGYSKRNQQPGGHSGRGGPPAYGRNEYRGSREPVKAAPNPTDMNSFPKLA
uniref:Hyaluronan/mRNA-binding protein domain-containing protein n=1 Tax=Compsopogon caeruleus TaxID=31354 RepID=A0A7S1TF33_9RHOD|mmetsp:Transcript_3666/g.7005  ORF Transcript_3666/g.7005 Transcript_3666/m.7005 type:complete len:396 (+) Transcript_3666:83-1270(+)